MKQILWGVGLLIVVGVIWAFVYPNTTHYTTALTDEVDQLEEELSEAEKALQDGTLSPVDALRAQERIESALTNINKAIAKGQSSLTEAQRAELVRGLERLRDLLTQYRDTLIAIDAEANKAPESERKKTRHVNNKRPLVEAISETIETVEEHVEEVIVESEFTEDETESEHETGEEETADDTDGETEQNTDDTEDNTSESDTEDETDSPEEPGTPGSNGEESEDGEDETQEPSGT